MARVAQEALLLRDVLRQSHERAAESRRHRIEFPEPKVGRIPQALRVEAIGPARKRLHRLACAVDEQEGEHRQRGGQQRAQRPRGVLDAVVFRMLRRTDGEAPHEIQPFPLVEPMAVEEDRFARRHPAGGQDGAQGRLPPGAVGVGRGDLAMPVRVGGKDPADRFGHVGGHPIGCDVRTRRQRCGRIGRVTRGIVRPHPREVVTGA